MKIFKVIIIIVLCLAVVLFSVGFIVNGFSFENMFSSGNRSIQTITEENEVKRIEIESKLDDIEFYISLDGKLRVEYYDDIEDPYYEYSYLDGTFKLVWKKILKLTWFNFKDIKTKVYLPKETIKEIKCDINTGEIDIKGLNLNLDLLEVKATTGETDIEYIEAKELKIESSTGNINLNSVKSPVATIKHTTGSIDIENCVINDINIEGSTGDIDIEDSTLTKMDIEASTGKVESENLTSDNVRVKTSTGSIKLNMIGNGVDYTIKAKVSTGSIKLTGNGIYSISDGKTIECGNGSKIIDASSNTGNIKVNFK